MAPLSRGFDWPKLWRDFTRPCAGCRQIPVHRVWRRWLQPSRGVRLRGDWYCGAECLESAVSGILAREKFQPGQPAAAPHRVPLGLLLLSREQVNGEQLRTAIDAQRAAGAGKIGEWLIHLGFVTETQITAALARQWSCPVLLTRPNGPSVYNFNSIPMALLEAAQMVPAEFSAAAGILLMAFSEAVDHTSLYAIEQMLGLRTEACFVSPSVLQKALQASLRARRPGDIVFERMDDLEECARIIGSYSAKLGAEEVRLARCGRHIWIRLERIRRDAVNLVLRTPGQNGSALRNANFLAAESSL